MKHVVDKDGALELDLGEILGEGRDGICYSVINNSLSLPDMALKVMYGSERASQILRHVQRLLSDEAKRSFSQVQSLECLLLTPFISGDGKCCLLMPRAHGVTLTDQDSLRDILHCSLGQRLKIAYQIALGMESVHRSQMIHADIAGPNVIIDTKHLNAYIIDIDGGGLVRSLAPRIKGHHGDYMAPELEPGNSRPPNQCSDCWSLAVVLHEVITGLSPFYFCHILRERSEHVTNWPPSASMVASEFRSYTDCHEETLERISDVAELFRRTFGIGQTEPNARPAASDWVQCLVRHLKELPCKSKPCPKCGLMNSLESIYCENDECQATLHRCLGSCHVCGQRVPINTMFCPECGRRQPY